MDRAVIGAGISAPPPIIGLLASSLVAMGARLARMLNRGFDPRPLAVMFISVLPFSSACGDDGGAPIDSTCEERGEVEVFAYGFCGCDDESTLAAQCSEAGNLCLVDEFGSVCSPPCDASGMCPDYLYESAFCDARTNRCLIACSGGDQGFNCPFGMECTANNGLEYCSYQGN
jgi:hypothetical protein